VVIDTSALIAILFNEPEGSAFLDAVLADAVRLVPAPVLVEATIVAEARAGENAGRELDLLIERLRANVVACSAEQALLARSAWRRYGRGRRRAGLNFGDCFSYAASKDTGEPLLFKGDDFNKTEVVPVIG
jgi:ribonuclease VapC